MKIKFTQSARDADVDTDFALAMALEDEAELCNGDDDFQATGSSPVIFNQTLALRHCSRKKQANKEVPRKNLKLKRKQRSGDEVGDAAQLANRAGRGKEMKIHGDAATNFMVESTATIIESEDLVSNERGRPCKEPRETGKRVLKDHNAMSMGRAKTGTAIADSVVLAKRDENGNSVKSGKVERIPVRTTPDLEESHGQENTSRRLDSSLACKQSEQQEQRDHILKSDSKGKSDSIIHHTQWCLHFDDTKKVKTTGVPENVGIQRFEQSEGSERLEYLGFEGDEGIERDRGAEADEDMVICTQVDAPIDMEFGRSPVEQTGVAVDMGKKTTEDRPKRKQNIYDILLGKDRKDRVPVCVLNFTIGKGPENDEEIGEMETPGTAMLALVDEAELDYEGLDLTEVDGSMDSFDCPVCGIDLVHISVSAREQHVSDCLENDNILCGGTNAGECPGREAENTEPNETVHLPSIQRKMIIGNVECPVCGVCIEELSTVQREEHTNSCLERDNMPCGVTNAKECRGREAESTEPVESVLFLSSQRNVILGTLDCPVCGVSIEELSTARREEHINACLDMTTGEELGEVAEFAGSEVAQTLGRPDVGPVVTWLTNMNLGKYVDIFVKEEIDWDTLKWLTEEDLNSLGITALGPRRKIVCAIQELKNATSSKQQILSAMQEIQRLSDSVVHSSPVDTLQGFKKSIADFFIPPTDTGQHVPAPGRGNLAGPKAPGTTSITGGSVRNREQRRPVSAGENLRSVGSSGIPTWMCIPGTSFRVDAFKHTTGNCSNWFLTHFHTDHYQGLTRGFRHGKIFCSMITARLVNLRIGIPLDRIQALPLNETVLIDGVRVTFVDANHCPGSVMILFEPPNGKAVLHTGDFRFCSDMTSNEVLRACRISTLILDTTYCDPQYDFPKQDAVIQFVIDAIQAEAFNPKTLFLIGTYTIGKERIFLEVGKALQKYVYVGAAKQRLLDCMDLAEEDKRWLTIKDQESHIHVVPLWSVASFKRMGSISRHYHGRYNSIVAFSPTGWSFGKDKKRLQGRPGRRYQQGSIIRYEVPYSEHSSFTELKEFVRTIASENIVPSVLSSTGPSADAMVASLLSDENRC